MNIRMAIGFIVFAGQSNAVILKRGNPVSNVLDQVFVNDESSSIMEPVAQALASSASEESGEASVVPIASDKSSNSQFIRAATNTFRTSSSRAKTRAGARLLNAVQILSIYASRFY